MNSKENIITLLKELEQEILALEEEMNKQTDNEAKETIAEYTYAIKKESRKFEMDMAAIQYKANDHIGDYKKDTPFQGFSLVHLT